MTHDDVTDHATGADRHEGRTGRFHALLRRSRRGRGGQAPPGGAPDAVLAPRGSRFHRDQLLTQKLCRHRWTALDYDRICTKCGKSYKEWRAEQDVLSDE